MRKASASSSQASQWVLADDIYISDWVPHRCFRRCCELFTDEVRSHKVTTEITLRFVTSVTSSPRLWSTTISGNFSSYDDIVCRSFCRQCR